MAPLLLRELGVAGVYAVAAVHAAARVCASGCDVVCASGCAGLHVSLCASVNCFRTGVCVSASASWRLLRVFRHGSKLRTKERRGALGSAIGQQGVMNGTTTVKWEKSPSLSAMCSGDVFGVRRWQEAKSGVISSLQIAACECSTRISHFWGMLDRTPLLLAV